MNNALNIMKSRVLLYCILLVIVCSCTKTVKQSKDFDIIETNEYIQLQRKTGLSENYPKTIDVRVERTDFGKYIYRFAYIHLSE